jgi:predicted transcriptional regulator
MKELTKAEEQVMQALWALKKGFVKDVIDKLPEPKSAYNTISTIIRILEKKGFVQHEAFGKTHRYYPLIGKKDYTRQYMQGFIKNYFSNSYQNMFSFFAKDSKITLKELEEMKELLENEIEKKKE